MNGDCLTGLVVRNAERLHVASDRRVGGEFDDFVPGFGDAVGGDLDAEGGHAVGQGFYFDIHVWDWFFFYLYRADSLARAALDGSL